MAPESDSAVDLAKTFVLSDPGQAKRACELAREAARERRFNVSEALYRAVILTLPGDACPLGAAAWVHLVVESIRLFRNVEWRSRDVLDRAIDIAVAHGDLRSQGVLLATRGWEAQRCGQTVNPEDFERAREAAAAVGDPALQREVHLLTAATLVYDGKFIEAIGVFEQYLGDVPAESRSSDDDVSDDEMSVREALFGPVTIAYAVSGQRPRALDIGFRMLERGTARNRPQLVHLAEMALAHVHLTVRDLERVRPFAEQAVEYWKTDHTQPLYLWLAAIALAWVRMCDDRPQEAQELLTIAHRARLAGAAEAYWGSALYEVLLWLEDKGLAPEGMTLDRELQSALRCPNLHLHGIAHRGLAMSKRRAADRGDEGAARQVDEHLALSESLLRRTGGLPELTRTLEARAHWDESRGRADAAAKAHAEAHDILRRIDPPPHRVGRDGSLARTIIDIGRLASLRSGESLWGELAARLCEELRVERAIIVEAAEPARILAARGGDAAWVDAVTATIAREPQTGMIPLPDPPRSSGTHAHAALVRFAAEGAGRRGVLVVENRHSRGMLDEFDARLFELLGAQLGVVVDNLLLRQELVDVRQRLEQETKYYREHGAASRRTDAVIGNSPAIRKVHDDVARVAPTDTTVLLSGETGVGKELFAREIHNQSARRDAPFVAVHIASLAQGLVASALFGHERGAFTGAVSQAQGRFELANRGTLFLDEIGELGLEEQVRLLRVLQEGTFERVGGSRTLRSDFRLIVATNRELESEVRAGRFRRDLYYRLNVFPIRVPPLRERTSDIPTMALYFMERSSRRLGRTFEGISEADMDRLTAYPWPGNVRELMHFIERAAVLSDGPRLRIPPLAAAEDPAKPQAHAEAIEWVSLAETERRYIRRVLLHAGGRVTGAGGAAEILGLKPSTLNFRIGKLGLDEDLRQLRRRGALNGRGS